MEENETTKITYTLTNKGSKTIEVIKKEPPHHFILDINGMVDLEELKEIRNAFNKLIAVYRNKL